MSAVLAAQQVDFCYADGTQALRSLSVAFPRGRRTALLGRNGAGKSTLLTLLNGIARPARGAVLCDGQPLRYDRTALRELRRRVGLVFQDPDSQLFAASIREDVSFGPLNLGLSKDEVRQRVAQALAAVGLAELADRPVHALSFGERKRACLAGVLAMEPEVLILDEPTAGLDPPMAAELTTLLDRLHAGGCTLIVATHDVDFAVAWADEICVLHEGTLAFQGAAVDDQTVCRALAAHGLGVPLVFELFRELWRQGLVRSDPPPRTRAELLARLAGGV
jgi:cobalt/nickel transport system ATP-binding protein